MSALRPIKEIVWEQGIMSPNTKMPMWMVYFDFDKDILLIKIELRYVRNGRGDDGFVDIWDITILNSFRFQESGTFHDHKRVQKVAEGYLIDKLSEILNMF